MKAKELMIGDYITFKDCVKEGTILPIKIVAIGYVERGKENEVLAQIGGDKTCDVIELDDECAGIPLTPEILEKNGFIYSELPFEQSWQQFGLSLYRGGEGYRVNCGNNVSAIIDSVNQLQHLFLLCGIEKEIEL